MKSNKKLPKTESDVPALKNRSVFSGGTIKNVLLDLLIAIPVFFLFVFELRIGGYDLLTLHPEDLLPPIPVYLADYSLTFTTKLLIGSVTGLFFDKITLEQMFEICGIANIIAVGVLALFFAALLRITVEKKQYPALFIAFFFILDPMIPQEYYPSIGGYNTYWTVLFVLLIFLYSSRGYYLLAPVLCVIGMLVHDGFLLSFLPVVMVLLVYDLCHADSVGKKTAGAVSFGLTGASCVSLFVYSSFFQNDHLKMTGDEFYEYMLSRFDLTVVQKWQLEQINGSRVFPFSFFETYFFDKYSNPGNEGSMSLGTYLSLFHDYLGKTLSPDFYLRYLVSFLPFAVLFAVLWGVCAKKSRGIRKLPFIFFACIEAVILPLGIISTDFHRWIPAAIISQAALVYAMIKKEDETFSEVLSSPILKKKPFIALMIVAACVCITGLALFCIDLPMMDDVM